MTVQPTSNLLKLQLIPVFESSYIRIELEAALKFIRVLWLRHPSSDEFREGFSKAADLTIAHHCHYWLSDSRAIHYLQLADQNWLIRLVTQLLPQVKLRRFARLNTLESLAMMDVPRTLNELEKLPDWQQHTLTKVFTEEDDALAWLFNAYN
ncbi:hypothetical protein [Pontibacter burrus]|uniref:STAS/SEC14 domain-containing protein n=1 Tax=Pontibacter burrus TaxID=2704466 RepID=A0A6B3LNX0_9BACT|nr:hypothetical protein [Pontibacter burrus]NEM98489.1 hypothetical protein [Pontibacter burrus]